MLNAIAAVAGLAELVAETGDAAAAARLVEAAELARIRASALVIAARGYLAPAAEVPLADLVDAVLPALGRAGIVVDVALDGPTGLASSAAVDIIAALIADAGRTSCVASVATLADGVAVVGWAPGAAERSATVRLAREVAPALGLELRLDGPEQARRVSLTPVPRRSAPSR